MSLSEVCVELRSRLCLRADSRTPAAPAVTASEPGSHMRAALRPPSLGGACVSAGCTHLGSLCPSPRPSLPATLHTVCAVSLAGSRRPGAVAEAGPTWVSDLGVRASVGLPSCVAGVAGFAVALL